MKLSNITNAESFLLKDGNFDWFGLTAEIYKDERLAYLSDKKYIPELLKNNSITCVITNEEIGEILKSHSRYGMLIVENPKVFFHKLYNEYVKKNKKNCPSEISEFACIDDSAFIAKENVVIEDGVLIEAGVIIQKNVYIKKNSIIRSGTTIGGNGFQFFKDLDYIIRVESSGQVIIGENVEIQNNCTIDKGVFGDTIICDNVKVDNLCHIAHDVYIGKGTLITAGTIFSGRVFCDENVYTGPNSVIRNGLKLEKNGRVSIGSVVVKDVKENEIVTGNFAVEHSKFLKITMKLFKIIK